MNQNQEQIVNSGDEVMKRVGELDAATQALKGEQERSSRVEPEEVGSWISIVGKALLAIFK